MIKPSIGRVVWFRPTADADAQPQAAIITYVHSDTCINIATFTPNGTIESHTSVFLHNENCPQPTSFFCEWMPYQMGQAAKTEAVEAKLAAKATPLTKTEAIAKVCHETNRAYCQTIGDNSQPTWEDAPQWQKDSAIKGVGFHFEHLLAGKEPPASASHDSWLLQKYAEGWKFGLVKDADKKEHPCCVPYHELPAEQRLKDYLFAAVVKAHYLAGVE